MCFHCIPKPGSTAGGELPSQPLPCLLQHHCLQRKNPTNNHLESQLLLQTFEVPLLTTGTNQNIRANNWFVGIEKCDSTNVWQESPIGGRNLQESKSHWSDAGNQPTLSPLSSIQVSQLSQAASWVETKPLPGSRDIGDHEIKNPRHRLFQGKNCLLWNWRSSLKQWIYPKNPGIPRW